DITWLKPDGHEMRSEDWATDWAQCVGLQLDGRDLPDADEHGAPLADAVFVLIFNAYYEAVQFTLPPPLSTGAWHLRFDTARGWVATTGPSPAALAPSSPYSLSDRSMALFEWVGQ
ncbi:MAG: glycogen debranching enzyme GlgX, partial [Acidobacteria bacterium]|nr:glycogen debranching enzyme GlgX [Acidobacteriota bacterium]